MLIHRKENIIILRPEIFHDRRILFIAQLHSNESMDCFRIPSHLQSKKWNELLHGIRHSPETSQITDKLVVHKSPVKTILTKVEKGDFIHTWLTQRHHATEQNTSAETPSGSSRAPSLLFELPRYQLELLVDGDGKLRSLQHAGYHLAQSQQLVIKGQGGAVLPFHNVNAHGYRPTCYTLPGFTQYLVLEKGGETGSLVGAAGTSRASTVVLIPEGEICRVENADLPVDVRVKVSDASSALLKVSQGQPAIYLHGISIDSGLASVTCAFLVLFSPDARL